MTTYVSTVPLAMVRTADGSYRNVYENEPIAGDAVEPSDLERLVRKGFLAERADSDDDADRPTRVKDILAAVGDDKALAQQYLDEENAAAQPRASLVEKLQAVVAAE